jgi:hypothetical protein
MSQPWAGTSVGAVLYAVAQGAFVLLCAAYAAFQVAKWRKGVGRIGTKLVYVATILALYWLTFSLDPRISSLWILITGTGHCAQYHAVVWAYGQKRYAPAATGPRTLPTRIFANVWLYVGLGLAFGLVTLQGPGAGMVRQAFGRFLAGVAPWATMDLGVKLLAAVLSGVRLHHFYVDSKIWKVGKSAALAKNLNVTAAARPA